MQEQAHDCAPRRRRRIAAAVAVLIALAPAAAPAAIALNANFDSGSLKSWNVAGNSVNLVGRDSYAFGIHPLGGDHWRWLYFRATGVQGLNPTFSITGEFGGDSTDYPPTPANHELADHEMVYSYDNENWQFFPHANSQLLNIGNPNTNGDNDIYRFSLGQPFTQDTVYVAYAIPYAYARTVQHTQSVLASPWAAPTASGDADGVIGQAPSGVDDIDRRHPVLDLYAYRITNPATDSAVPKRRAFFTTGQHAAETLGIYTFEGLVNWLISNDPRAAALRDQAEFFCYPTLNASGRYAGLSRSMLGHQNTDSNGYWYPGPDGNNWSSRPEQRENGEAMQTDFASTPGDSIDLLVDFHSSVPDYQIADVNGEGSGGRDDWGYIRSGLGDNPWWQALRQLQPNLLQINSGSGPTSRTTTGFAQNDVYGLNADMAVTLENQFAISRPVSYYHDLGKNAGLAMYEAWIRVDKPLSGDFDEDGDVDAGDLAAWQFGFGTDSGAAHYQGDANADGAVDGADFLIWQQQVGSTSPPASSVPEPASLTLLFIVILAARGRIHAH